MLCRRSTIAHCGEVQPLTPSVLHLQGDKTKYATYLASRPRSFEKTAVRMLLEVMEEGARKAAAPGFGLHLVHVTDSDLLPELAQAKAAGTRRWRAGQCTALPRITDASVDSPPCFAGFHVPHALALKPDSRGALVIPQVCPSQWRCAPTTWCLRPRTFLMATRTTNARRPSGNG